MTNALALQHQYVVSLHHQYIVPLHSQYVVPLRQRCADVFGRVDVLTDPHIKLEAQRGYLEVRQTGQEATSAHEPVTKCPKIIYEAG